MAAWYDGINVYSQVNLGSIAVGSATVTVIAGTPVFVCGRDTTSSANFFGGTIIGQTYIRNGNPSAATRLLAQQLMARWAGITL